MPHPIRLDSGAKEEGPFLCGNRKNNSDWPKIKTRNSKILDGNEASINW